MPSVQEGLGFGAVRGGGAVLRPSVAAQLPPEKGGRAISSLLSMKMANHPAVRGRCLPGPLSLHTCDHLCAVSPLSQGGGLQLCAYLLLRAGAWKGTSISSHSVSSRGGLTDPHFITRILWFRERSLSLFNFTQWRRHWRPTPVFLPGESQGWQSLVGCRLWGRTESDTTEAT